jgi:hypothetical protein
VDFGGGFVDPSEYHYHQLAFDLDSKKELNA